MSSEPAEKSQAVHGRETIIVRNVKKFFGPTRALDGVNFTARAGEIHAVVGGNGCGKSTILSMTAGLYQPTVGDVLVSGETVTGPNQHVGFMLQKDLLLPWRSIVHNIEFGLESRGVAREERRAIAMKELKHCHLDGFEGHYPYQLSGGMRQRAALARTLAIDPEIILLDEPFSALDPLIRDRLQDELLDLQASLNRTIIFVSHDLDEAAKIGSRIAIMDGGRVIQLGTPQEIVRKPANDYVADFVGHMNPLNVLRARDIMSACDRTPVPEGAVTCRSVTPLRDVIKLKRQSETDILVAEDGRVLGRIGEDELLDSMI